jgi:hypothetical protein
MDVRKTLRFDPRGRIVAAYRLAATDGAPIEGCFGVELNFFLPGLVAGSGAIRVGRRRLDPAVAVQVKATGCVLSEAPGGAEVRVDWDAPGDLLLSPIRTASQTERGFELTCQGHALVVAWPFRLPAGGEWTMQIRAGIGGSRASAEGGRTP